jgi:TPR repeat protein
VEEKDPLEQAELLRGEHPEEARRLYRVAIARGMKDARRKYGVFLSEEGECDEAEKFLREAAQDGELAACRSFADFLLKHDRPTEAARVLTFSFHCGNKEAALRVAAIYAELIGDRRKAEQWYKKSIKAGDSRARNDFAVFLMDDESCWGHAEELLRQAIDEGDTRALGNLGALELDRNNLESAVYWCSRGLAAGHVTVLLNLAAAETALGLSDAARSHLDRAVREGVEGSRLARANFIADDERAGGEEAEDDYLAAVDAGEEDAEFCYALFLADHGRKDEAIEYYQRAIDRGSVSSYLNLGMLYEESGDLLAAERYYRGGVMAGHSGALRNYGIMLYEQDRQSDLAALIGEAEAMAGFGGEVNYLRELWDDLN